MENRGNFNILLHSFVLERYYIGCIGKFLEYLNRITRNGISRISNNRLGVFSKVVLKLLIII